MKRWTFQAMVCLLAALAPVAAAAPNDAPGKARAGSSSNKGDPANDPGQGDRDEERPSSAATASDQASDKSGEGAASTEPDPGEPTDDSGRPKPSQSERSQATARGRSESKRGDSKDTGGSAMRAYQTALVARKLGASEPISKERIAEELAEAEDESRAGRTDEAIGDLVYLVESPRFEPFRNIQEGRAARFLLGDLLGRAGAEGPARGYLTGLVQEPNSDVWSRRAVRSLVDLGLESDHPERILQDLEKATETTSEELRGDIAYLRGRTLERSGKVGPALAELSRVTPRSRFWAQATYLAGLIEVERGKLKKGEQLFCKIADAKQTPKAALVFGGAEFFRVRDLARLGLGRIAHEQYRFDDARYYYYLVPADSEVISEALYESATGRYEAKDYGAARELVDRLRTLERSHVYEDELWVFDAYLDMAECNFPRADKKLREFIFRYEPVRDAARALARDESARRALAEAVRTGADPRTAGLGFKPDVVRALAALLRVDEAHGRVSRRLARLEHQMSGLRRSMAELDDAHARLGSDKEVVPRAAEGLFGDDDADPVHRAEAQVAEVRRLLRDVERSGKARPEDIKALRKELRALELRVRALGAASGSKAASARADTERLEDLVRHDRALAAAYYREAEQARRALLSDQSRLAGEALGRLEARLSRLLRRARLGRIETVLGKKRALEVEIEALSQGLLPRGAVDSLDAARYLKDDEEYWPDDGEDWADEYVGGEGLR